MRSKPETAVPRAESSTAELPGQASQEELARTSSTGTTSAAQRFRAWARRTLAQERVSWLMVAVAMALTSTALTLELTADDHFHVLALREGVEMRGVQRAPWDLFAFAKNPAVNDELIEEGVFPWWSDREARISFLRPLAAFTHWLDHRLWPSTPVLMHAHSMLWFAALLLVVSRLYRKLTPSPFVAGLALLVYAIDDAKAMPIGWISNRNALVALVPGFAVLYVHHLWRSERRASYALLAVGLLVIALFSAEASLQVCGYLGAYALCLESGPWHRRLFTLLPYIPIVLAWRAFYSALGYGASGSDFYLDPGQHPLAFAQALLARYPTLLLAQFATPFADFWDAYPVFAPAMRTIVPLVGALVVVALGALLWPLLKADARLRFWALGTLFATVPVCGASPTDRLLTATGVGASVLIASLLAPLFEQTELAARGLRRFLVGALALVHLVVAPLLLPLRTAAVDVMEGFIARAAASVPADDSVRNQTLVIINPPAEHYAAYFPLYRESHRIPRPKHFRWLATGMNALDITRVDAHSLRVRPEGGFLANEVQWLLRSRARPFSLGNRVVLEDVTYEVTALTEDLRPAEVLVRFREPLDSEALRFMQWAKHEYVPFEVPKVGESVHVPRVNLHAALLGHDAS